jgi:hypothetical protein
MALELSTQDTPTPEQAARIQEVEQWNSSGLPALKATLREHANNGTLTPEREAAIMEIAEQKMGDVTSQLTSITSTSALAREAARMKVDGLVDDDALRAAGIDQHFGQLAKKNYQQPMPEYLAEGAKNVGLGLAKEALAFTPVAPIARLLTGDPTTLQSNIVVPIVKGLGGAAYDVAASPFSEAARQRLPAEIEAGVHMTADLASQAFTRGTYSDAAKRGDFSPLLFAEMARYEDSQKALAGQGALSKAAGAAGLVDASKPFSPETRKKVEERSVAFDPMNYTPAGAVEAVAGKSALLAAKGLSKVPAGASFVEKAAQLGVRAAKGAAKILDTTPKNLAAARGLQTLEQAAKATEAKGVGLFTAAPVAGEKLVQVGKQMKAHALDVSRVAAAPTISGAALTIGATLAGADLGTSLVAGLVATGVGKAAQRRLGTAALGQATEMAGNLLVGTKTSRAALQMLDDYRFAKSALVGAGVGAAAGVPFALLSNDPEEQAAILTAGGALGSAHSVARTGKAFLNGVTLRAAGMGPKGEQAPKNIPLTPYGSSPVADSLHSKADTMLSNAGADFVGSLRETLGDRAEFYAAASPEDANAIAASMGVKLPEGNSQGVYFVRPSDKKPVAISLVGKESGGHETTHALLKALEADPTTADAYDAAYRAADKALGAEGSKTFDSLKREYETIAGAPVENLVRSTDRGVVRDYLINEVLAEHGSVLLAGLPSGKLGGDPTVTQRVVRGLLKFGEKMNLRNVMSGDRSVTTSKALKYNPQFNLLDALSNVVDAVKLEDSKEVAHIVDEAKRTPSTQDDLSAEGILNPIPKSLYEDANYDPTSPTILAETESGKVPFGSEDNPLSDYDAAKSSGRVIFPKPAEGVVPEAAPVPTAPEVAPTRVVTASDGTVIGTDAAQVGPVRVSRDGKRFAEVEYKAADGTQKKSLVPEENFAGGDASPAAFEGEPVAPGTVPQIRSTPEGRAALAGAGAAPRVSSTTPENVRTLVEQHAQTPYSERKVLRADYDSAVKTSEGDPTRDVRAEQLQRASKLDALGLKNPLREAADKAFIPTTAGKSSKGFYAYNLDKVAANLDRMAIWGTENPEYFKALKTGYDSPTSPEILADHQNYQKNQANGYAGDGRKLAQVSTEGGTAEPLPVTPGYVPVKLPKERAQFLNMLMGTYGKGPSAIKSFPDVFSTRLAEAMGVGVHLAEGVTETGKPKLTVEANAMAKKLESLGFDPRDLETAFEQLKYDRFLSQPEVIKGATLAPAYSKIVEAGLMPDATRVSSEVKELLDVAAVDRLAYVRGLDITAEGILAKSLGVTLTSDKLQSARKIVDAASKVQQRVGSAEGLRGSIAVPTDRDGLLAFSRSNRPSSQTVDAVLDSLVRGDNALRQSVTERLGNAWLGELAKAFGGEAGERLPTMGFVRRSLNTAAKTREVSTGALRPISSQVEVGVSREGSVASSNVFEGRNLTPADRLAATGMKRAEVQFMPAEHSPEGAQYTDSVLSKLRAVTREGSDGDTFNQDGTQYTGGGLVVPLVSQNFDRNAIKIGDLQAFKDANADKMSPAVKVGVYKFPNSEDMSVDLNIVVDPKHEALARRVGADLGQESLFDLGSFENVKTGASGKSTLPLTPEQFKRLGDALSKGEYPQDVITEAYAQHPEIAKAIQAEIAPAKNYPDSVEGQTMRANDAADLAIPPKFKPYETEAIKHVLENLPEKLKEGDTLGEIALMPDSSEVERLLNSFAITEETKRGLLGKTGFCLVSDWADSNRFYLTESGRKIDVMMGGVGYSYHPEVIGKGAWAATSSHLGDKLIEKVNAGDGIGLVVMGGPESSAASRSFSLAFIAELEDAISLKKVTAKNIDKLVAKAFNQSGRPEIKTLNDYANIVQKVRGRQKGDLGTLTFEDRADIVKTIGSDSNRAEFGFPSWINVLNKYNIQKGTFEPGQIVSVVQFDKGPGKLASEIGARAHPSYELVVTGKPIGMVTERVMIGDFLKSYFESRQKAPKNFLRVAQLNMPKFKFGEGGSVLSARPTDVAMMPEGPLSSETVKGKDVQFRRAKPIDGAVGGVLDIVHFSSKELKEIDPSKSFGKGAATSADRQGMNKAFFYTKGTAYEGPIAGRSNVYSTKVDGNSIYDYNADNLGVRSIVNREKRDQAIIDAGFKGYFVKTEGFDAVAIFDKVKVDPVLRQDVMSKGQMKTMGLKPQEKMSSVEQLTSEIVKSPEYARKRAEIAKKVGSSSNGEFFDAMDAWTQKQVESRSTSVEKEASTAASFVGLKKSPKQTPVALMPSGPLEGERTKKKLNPLGLFSQVERTLDAIPEKANRQQIDAMIRDGVKEKGKLLERPVRKEELEDLKDTNGVSLGEFLKQNTQAGLPEIREFVEAAKVPLEIVEVEGNKKAWEFDGETFETEREAERARDEALQQQSEDAYAREWEYQFAGVNRRGDAVVNEEGGNTLYRLKKIPESELTPKEVEQVEEYGESFFKILDETDEEVARVRDSRTDRELESLATHHNDRIEVDSSFFELDVPSIEETTLHEGGEYGDWTLRGKGGDNYREIVFTLGDGNYPSFESNHYQDVDGNYLAHARVDVVGATDNKTAYLVDEIQSDRHQQARDEGYDLPSPPVTPERRDQLTELLDKNVKLQDTLDQKNQEASRKFDQKSDDIFKRLKELLNAEFPSIAEGSKMDLLTMLVSARPKEGNQKVIALRDEYNTAKKTVDDHFWAANTNREEQAKIKAELNPSRLGSVPDAPFKKSWKELVFKALLNDAVNKGHEYFVWTPGDVHAERYSNALQKAVDTVEATKNPDNTYNASFYKNGNVVSDEKAVSATRIVDLVGKAAAQKILSEADKAPGEPAVIEGATLKVGGEGMRAVYDRVLVNFANDYLKKWGVKVGEVNVSLPDAVDRTIRQNGAKVHGFEITPQMRDDIRANGQAAYMPAEKEGVKSATSPANFPVGPLASASVSSNREDDKLPLRRISK